MATGTRTNFAGYSVTVFEGGMVFPVIAATPGSVCDHCEAPAEYIVNAVGFDRDCDVYLCQDFALDSARTSPDTWTAPEDAEPSMAEVMARVTGSVGSTYVVTERDAVTGELRELSSVSYRRPSHRA